MIPILYGETETTYTSNGIGRLSNAVSCVVTEERNGEYELEMEYPVDGIHFADIQKSRIISAVPADGKPRQPFRIYRITKPINGIVTVYAEHISYQLSMIPVMPFTAGSAAETVVQMGANVVGTNPFTLWTDITTVANFNQKIPKSFRASLGGSEGSFLDTYGGEFEWDNYTVKIHADRGVDHGVTIRYGKNLTDLTQEENIQETITGVLPYWYNEDENILVTIPEKVVMSSNAGNFPYTRVVPLDLIDRFDSQPTQAQLRSAAQSYINTNNIGVPEVSLEVSFAALWQTDEYKDRANLERINLCDTVTVVFEKLGVSATAKVVRTEYNVLLDRYDQIEIGEARSNFADTFVKTQEELTHQVQQTKSELQRAVDAATDLINSGFGGYVTYKPNADGEFEELLIMDTKDPSTATKVWRWNLNGLGYSSTGYQGPYTTAITMNGHIVADFVDTGTLTANIVKSGVLSDSGGNTVLNMSTGALTAKKLSVTSTNFNLTESGDLTANSATLTDCEATGSFITSKTSGARTYRSALTGGKFTFSDMTGSRYDMASLDVWVNCNTFENQNRVNAFMLDMGMDTPFIVVTGEAYGETPGSYWRFFVNDGGKDMDLDEWVYAEDLFVLDHIRFWKTDGPEIGSASDKTFLVGTSSNQCGLSVWGEKQRVVRTKNYGDIGMNAMESATAVFSDMGAGRIDETGVCCVFISPDFAETVDLSHDYQVFLTQTSQGHIEWTEKEADCFTVYGDPGTTFDWIIYARQRDYVMTRMESVVSDEPDVNMQAGYWPVIESDKELESAMEYLNQYESEVEAW